MSINYKSSSGKRLADFSAASYQTANNTSPIGQCVWYVRGRAKEKIGVNTGIVGNANTWYSQAKSKGLKLSGSPKSDSIACFNSGKYGHVIYIEYVEENVVYYTEANSNLDNKLSSDDGILKSQILSKFTARSGYQGCIVLAAETEKVKSEEKGTKKGDKIKLSGEPLYLTSTSKTKSNTISGDYYVYDSAEIKGRIRITTKAEYCGKTPASAYVTGWITAK